MCSYINVCAAWFDVKTNTEVVNNKTFVKLNEAIGVAGLHGLDTLYGHMIKNQLQHVQHILRSQDTFSKSIGIEEIEQIILKNQKYIQQIADVLLVVGTLQLLRKHIAYQLNTSCKFDSAHLEASLRTMNEYVSAHKHILLYLIYGKKNHNY